MPLHCANVVVTGTDGANIATVKPPAPLGPSNAVSSTPEVPRVPEKQHGRGYFWDAIAPRKR
jgi:hypothetical protein